MHFVPKSLHGIQQKIVPLQRFFGTKWLFLRKLLVRKTLKMSEINENQTSKNTSSPKTGFGYRAYKSYVRWMQNHLLYRRVHYLNMDRLPQAGTPCIIVSNHQNCANDPLGILLGLENEYRPYVIARADAFGIHPLVAKFFYWIGMLPAFRMDWEGADAVKKNDEIFRISGGKLLEGNRLIMFPEGGHQDKHFLGEFKYGYTRLAFLTAEMGNFERDVVILPVAHHYSRYFGMQADFMVTVGEPISLAPYYELYKTKPRTAQREVNKLVRQQIEQMMLDVRDTDNYEAIDFIRETWGVRFAEKNGKNPNILPEKLASDKQLVAHLAQCQAENPDEIKAIYNDALALKQGEKALHICDSLFDHCPSALKITLAVLAQILLLPLWIVALFPNAIAYNLPKLLLKQDKMFTNTLIFILDVVVLLPLFAVATLLVMGLAWGLWWQAAVWILLWPALALFAWYDYKWMQRTCQAIKFRCNKLKIKQLRDVRERMHAKLNTLFNI